MKIQKILKLAKIWILWFWKEWKSIFLFLEQIWFKWKIFIFDQSFSEKIDDKKTTIISWKKAFDNLFDCDFYIKSPWISRHIFPKIQKQFEEWKIISSTEIFLNNQKWKVVWITWTKWKSTTSSLIFAILKEEFWENVEFVWNIWNPWVEVLQKTNKDKIYVLELSSYQVEDLSWKNIINYWILLNIFPDHLDYHLWFENYKKAKLNLQNISTNFLNSNTFDFSEEKKIIWKKIKLKWDHNYKNALIATKIAKSFWISDFLIKKIICNFKWLPYRLEELREKNRLWIDDSLSTNPDSTLAWVKTYEKKINWIILWWLDRGYDFSELISYLSEIKNLKAIALLPENDLQILALIEKKFEIMPKIFISKDMNKIVQFLFENSEKNWVIMLSTASPSYSLYKNYIEKSDLFKKSIESLK